VFDEDAHKDSCKGVSGDPANKELAARSLLDEACVFAGFAQHTRPIFPTPGPTQPSPSAEGGGGAIGVWSWAVIFIVTGWRPILAAYR
jgi:hypothetical protein